MQKKVKANFHQDYSIVFNPQNTTQCYGVKYTVLNAQDEVEKVLHYETLIKIKHLSPQTFSFHLFKENVRLNYKKLDLVVEKLSNHVVKCLYPIEFLVNQNLEILEPLINHKDIINRWEEEKKQISKKYQSGTTNKFCKKVDNILKNKTILYYKIQQDWFFSLYFHHKHLTYTATLKQPSTLQVPIIPYNAKISFQGILQPLEHITGYGTLQIIFEGESKSKDLQLIHSKFYGQELYSQIHVIYDLDNMTHQPIHTKFLCKIFDTNQNVQRTIKYEMFALNDSKNELLKPSKNKMQFFIDEKPQKK